MGAKLWHIALFVAIIIVIAAVLHPTHFREGWMYLRSGMALKASAELYKAYEKDRNDYHAMTLLAEALESEGKVGEAGTLFEKLVEIKPSDDNFRELARFYTWTLQPAKAKYAYEQWMDFRIRKKIPFDDEDGKQILDDLYAYELLYQDFERAIFVLKLLKEASPEDNGWIDDELIVLYESIGDAKATVALLEKMLNEDPGNEYALYKFMQLAAFTGKTAKAKQYLIMDVEDNPQDEKAWDRLINFEASLGDLDAADHWYSKRLEADPDNQALEKQYVGWLLATEQQRRAISYLEGIAPARLSDPYYEKTLVDLYEWNGDKARLVPIYEARFAENPYDRSNADKLVWLLDDLKMYDREERVLKRLVELSPGNDQYAEMLANFYETRNNSAAAIAALEKATQKNKDPALLKRLGELYLWSAEAPAGKGLAGTTAVERSAPKILPENKGRQTR